MAAGRNCCCLRGCLNVFEMDCNRLAREVHTYPIEDIALEISHQQGYTTEDCENKGANLEARVSVCLGGRCGQLAEDGRKFRMICECSIQYQGEAWPNWSHTIEIESTTRDVVVWSICRSLQPFVAYDTRSSYFRVPPTHRYLFRCPID